MNKTLLFSVCLLFGSAVTITAAIGGPGLSRGSGPRQDLGCPDLPILGEKQFHKVLALEEAFLKESELLKHHLLTERTELRILELSADPDPTVVKAEEEEIRDLEAKLHEEATTLRFGIWKVLNPEQRARFEYPRAYHQF